jgi:plastocyanin
VKSNSSAVSRWAIASALLAAFGCGGGAGTNPSPVGGSPGPSGATITIGANNAVSPSSVTISVGQSVTFVNNDSRVHEMASDPHPAHTDCPPINALGVLGPGQSALTNALTTARTCGFHDHRDDSNPNLRGTITIR